MSRCISFDRRQSFREVLVSISVSPILVVTRKGLRIIYWKGYLICGGNCIKKSSKVHVTSKMHVMTSKLWLDRFSGSSDTFVIRNSLFYIQSSNGSVVLVFLKQGLLIYIDSFLSFSIRKLSFVYCLSNIKNI